MFKLGNDWDFRLKDEVQKDYYQKLRCFLAQEYKDSKVYPDMNNIFNALKNTSFEDTKVVLLGQDPYHGALQAQGLCFSVSDGTPFPPSLVNIFKEISSDLAKPISKSGELFRWAKQGVLLLNTVLTVRDGCPNSHKNCGWETFTDHIIEELNKREKPIVFLLWGANARSKTKLITNPKHLVLQTSHPSPLSVYQGFCGCKHFSKTNEFLRSIGEKEIDW